MKIKINYWKLPENSEIEVIELKTIDKIKELVQNLIQDHKKKIKLDILQFVYKDFILMPKKCLNFYKISSGEEIWCGQLKDYLKINDVIVEIFLTRWNNHHLYLIVKKFDPISVIIEKIKMLITEFKDYQIWNGEGKVLLENEIIENIDPINNYHKLIINFNDKLTFDDCCAMYDQSLIHVVGRFYKRNEINSNDTDGELIKKQNNYLDKLFNTIKFGDRKLNKTLKYPESFQKSQLFFCLSITKIFFYYINKDFKEFKRKFIDEHERPAFDTFTNHFKAMLLVIMIRNHGHYRSRTTKDFIMILKNEEFQYAENDDRKSKPLLIECLNKFSFRKYDISEMDEIIRDLYISPVTITVFHGSQYLNRIIIKKCQTTIKQIKEQISEDFGVNYCDLLLKESYSVEPPNDDDVIHLKREHKYIIMVKKQ